MRIHALATEGERRRHSSARPQGHHGKIGMLYACQCMSHRSVRSQIATHAHQALPSTIPNCTPNKEHKRSMSRAKQRAS
jgi:hypothetical protein